MCVLFFKQNTAYEMRVSDWSSDVCSSDLRQRPPTRAGRRNPDKNRETSSPTAVDTEKVRQRRSRSQARSTRRAHEKQSDQEPDTCRGGSSEQPPPRQMEPDAGKQSHRKCCGPSIALIAKERSEERRVGQEWVSTCRSRGSPYN